MEKAGEILIGIAVLIGCNFLVYEVWRVDGVTAAIAAVILLLFCVGLFFMVYRQLTTHYVERK